MSSKLTSRLEREVVKRAAAGDSSGAISEWLKKAHGISISGQALRKRLQGARIERGEAIKAVVREELGPTVKSDIAHLERIRSELEDDRIQARACITRLAKGDSEDGAADTWQVREASVWAKLYAKLTELELKAIDRKLHFSGADAPDDNTQELSTAGERVRSRLARLASKPGEGAAPEGTCSDSEGGAGP